MKVTVPGVTAFTQLSDVPHTFLGASLKNVSVNSGETGLEFTTGGVGSAVWGSITGTLSNQTDLQSALNGKQATLVSGTNIKTVNGNTLLGSGDVSISSSVAWGSITGTLSSQTDLNTALNGKVAGNTAIIGATKTKVTYDTKGLVTSGTDATTADIADSTNKRYVTDAQLTVIGNTSGTNSGDQTISITGDVTASGSTGALSATVTKINGTALSGLATGILKNTTTTGVPSIATAGTDYQAPITLTTTGTSGAATFVGNTLNIPNYATGGGGSPGGSDTQIQFNDAGAFGGDADFTWNKTTNDLVLGGTDTGITLAGITNEPSAPSAGNLHVYSKSIAGKMVPKVKGPSGLDTPLQNAFWQNNITMWNPTTATAGVWLGTAGAGAGTYTTALPTTTNLYTAIKRGRWANVVTTTNQVLGQRNTEAMYFRGGSTGQGGFFFYTRCGFDVWTNGGRFFAGMHSGTTVVSADPSALNNTVGFCVDAADNGAISFLTRGTAATKASTGFTITSNKGYDLYIFCAPNSSQYTWRIVDFVAGTEASGTATLNLPTNTTMLTAGVLASNAALTTVTAIHLGINKIYIETDY
jgi:hypothetical protein